MLNESTQSITPDRRFVFELEQEVGYEDEIERPVGDLRCLGFFKVCPNDLHLVEAALVRFVVNALQKVLLHIDRKEMPAGAQRLRHRPDVMSRTRTKIRDGHSRLNTEMQSVARRMREPG